MLKFLINIDKGRDKTIVLLLLSVTFFLKTVVHSPIFHATFYSFIRESLAMVQLHRPLF